MKIGGRSPPFPDAELIRALAALLTETGLTEIEYSLGERRIRVARLFRLVDADAGRIRDRGVTLDERRDMVRDLVNIGGIWLEYGLVCYCLASSERGSAKLHHPFRDCIDVNRVRFGKCQASHERQQIESL